MKIFDAAKRDTFQLSSTSGDLDYGHVIDEIIEELDSHKFSFTKKEMQEGVIGDLPSVLASFDVRKDLNNRVWQDNIMNSRVRLRLLDIADEFIEFLNVSWVEPKDVILTGSLANYNWSKYSDFDLHVLMDFEKVDKRTDFVKEYFDSKKTLWNEQHSHLKIYGFPVELYVQDINEEHTASGIYSLYKNKWIKEPEYDDLASVKLDKDTIKKKTLKFIKIIDKLVETFNKEKDTHKIEELSKKIKETWDKMKGTRKEALKKGNELSIGNLVWKCLRRLGYIEKLLDLKYQTYDKIKTIK
jgi:predicted nucleotidyltransferase